MSRTLREAAQMALDALTNCLSEHGHRCNRCDSEIDEGGKLIAALRAALAAPEPEPEPVAWYYVEDPWGANEWHFMTDSPESQECDPRDWTPLYATPPAAPAPAAPVVREPQPEPVQRLMRFAGKKRSEVSNPCLTAREAIVIADWMQAHGITGGSNAA